MTQKTPNEQEPIKEQKGKCIAMSIRLLALLSNLRWLYSGYR